MGKISVINRVLHRKNFARVGDSPERPSISTTCLVDRAYFTDLPGYGYAKVSKSERGRWGR